MKPALLLLSALPAFAVTIPAGAQFGIRLTDKISSKTSAAGAPVHALLIAPVAVNGQILLPAGPGLSGVVQHVRAATGSDRAQLDLVFTEIQSGSYRTGLNARVSALDNSRETVDAQGVIVGIDASEAYGSRIDKGISKLQNSDRFAGLAGLVQTAKQALKIQDVDADIDCEPGVEMTLRLTAPLDWRGPVAGPEAELLPFPDQDGLVRLVDSQPYRTAAAQPPRPSDITNLMFVGTEEELRAAFEKAGWSSAVRLSTQSKLETARALIEDRGYNEGPMSVLLLDGRPPDLMLQKGNDTFSKRHHLRIFRRPGTFAGKPVWVCSSTHDINIVFSERDRTFIHKVDSNIDAERAKVVNDLLFTGLVRSLALVDRPAVPLTLTNATGDTLQTDGRMAVLLF